jgi:hypothetical protein
MDIKIEKLTVSAHVRALSSKWRVIESKWDIPKHVKVAHFPHKVQVYPRDIYPLMDWCKAHVGALDHTWTWLDASEFRFRDLDAATQFSLTLTDEP